MVRKIGVAIAAYNRVSLVRLAFAEVYDDPRIVHVAISDDNSDPSTYQALQATVSDMSRVSLSRNKQNLGSWANKRRAVELCCADWVAVIDSDNVIAPNFLDALWAVPEWDETVLYIPAYGPPVLNYGPYEGLIIDRWNIANWLSEPLFQMALNTGNFFVHRETHLAVSDGEAEASYASDGIYFVYRWLASGRSVYVTPNLSYTHLVHDGSHWMNTAARSTAFANDLVRRMDMGHWYA